MINYLKNKIEQVIAIYNQFSPKRRLVAILTILLTIASLIALIAWANRTEYTPLYSGLSSEDSGAVINSLKSRQTLYKIGPDGYTILVPDDLVNELRMELAGEGLPLSSGTGYKIFDPQDRGVTEFIQKANFQRTLQEEPSRTINQFEEVKSSRVHLTIHKEPLFFEDRQKPQAFVVLTLFPGKRLRENQIQGITHLVASSVDGMDPVDVIIVDSHGKLLSGAKEKFKHAGLTSSQQEIQLSMERGIEGKIVSMMNSVLGPDKVTAKVSVDLDFTQVEQTQESYDPEASAVRSEQRSTEKSSGKRPYPGGVSEDASNIPAQQKTAGNKSIDFKKEDETVNYEINRVTKKIVKQAGSINRLTAAVLIDGTYQTKKDQDGNEVRQYVPINEEEMNKYETLIKRAVGYDEDRGDWVEVVNVQFHEMVVEEESLTDRLLDQIDLQYMITYVITVFLFVLLFFFGLKPLVRVLLKTVAVGVPGAEVPEEKSKKEDGGSEEELSAGLLVDQAEAVGDKQANLIQFAKKNPRLFAQYLKGWLETN
jgi:flagellar M-ring protein FliF